MKSILLSVLLSSVVYSEKSSFIELPALADSEHHVKIGDKYVSEIECLRKLDALLVGKWTRQLNAISTTDLGNFDDVSWQVQDSAYTRYNTLEEEWLMNDNLPASRIDQCFRNLVSDVVPLMSQGEINCLNDIFESHVVGEIDHQEEFERILKSTVREQLPFRKFISFTELVEILFQNRNPDALTDLERVLYEHADSYLVTDSDKARLSYTGTQDCDWTNARALRQVSGEKAKFAEFVSQVRRTVNRQLGSELVRKWSLNSTLPRERYERWLQARRDMMPRLEKEVGKLRKQKKDVQWLCEYATKLATQFTDEQLDILLMEDSPSRSIHFGASDVAAKARAIERALGKLNDFRHAAIKKIADNYEEGTTCLFSFLHVLQNHKRYDLAHAFMDERYAYPEIYCGGKNKNFGLVQMTFCNCIGSFCIAHPLAALFADEYAFAQGPDGTYQVVRSGRKSKRKITHCHILANRNKMV